MKQIPVMLRTLDPVVLSAMSNATVMTTSHSFISGSILRGIIAKRYIEQKMLGKEAHNDDVFLRLFFTTLRFTAAYPVSKAGRCSFPVPLSLQLSKDGQQLKDLLQEKSEAGFKGMKNFITVKDADVTQVTVNKIVHLHMSRSDQKEKNGKERLAGRSSTGGIYNYEAITEGQNFSAFIYGEEKDLQSLRNTLQASQWTCYVGRSKYAQYGKCSLQLGNIEAIPVEGFDIKDNTICLRLDAPLLSAESNILSVEQGLSMIADTMNEQTQGGFSICYEKQKVFAKAELIENFVSSWGLKRPRVQALAAGTVFLLQKDSEWSADDKQALQNLLYTGVGYRTEEGFGQLRPWYRRNWQIISDDKDFHIEQSPFLSKSVKKLAQKIIKQHILEQAQVWAAEDVQAAKLSFQENSAHFFARLSAMLGTKADNVQEHLRQSIKNEQGNNATPFAQALTKIVVHKKTLKDYFVPESPVKMPYTQQDWQKLAKEWSLSQIFSELAVPDAVENIKSSNDLFYTYWYYFFRYARKVAAGASKGSDAK